MKNKRSRHVVTFMKRNGNETDTKNVKILKNGAGIVDESKSFIF